MRSSKFVVFLLCCIAFSSLFSASILTINFAGFQLSIFRLLLPCFFLVAILLNKNRAEGEKIYTRLMFVWLIYALFSIVWISDFSSWTKAIYFIATGLMCAYVFGHFVSSPIILSSVCKAYSFGILVHNIIGWYEIITKDYNWVTEKFYAQILRMNSPIPVSVFYNPNDYATILFFGVFCLLIAIYFSKSRFVKCFYLTIMLSSIVQLVLTQ